MTKQPRLVVFDITVFGVRGRAEEKGMRGVRERERQGRGGREKGGERRAKVTEPSKKAGGQGLRKRPQANAFTGKCIKGFGESPLQRPVKGRGREKEKEGVSKREKEREKRGRGKRESKREKEREKRGREERESKREKERERRGREDRKRRYRGSERGKREKYQKASREGETYCYSKRDLLL